MHTMDTLGYGHKKYRPPLSPTSFYQPDYSLYSRHTTLRPQSEYRFAGSGYPRTSSSSSRSGGLCSAALVGGALLAAVAVLAVAALAFYMGALRPDNGQPIMAFEGTFRVTRGDVYGGAPGSPAWRERARRYSSSLRQVYSIPSILRPAFAGAVVTGFGDRRLDVHFRLYLDRRKIPSTVTNIEESLKNILVQDLSSKNPAFGQIKIDTSSITIKRDLEHTYHSEQYVKEAMNETVSHSNNSPKSLTPQNNKSSPSRTGVVRKTTIKPNPAQKHDDPDEPVIDTENIPVVQGSFQITKTEADITENKHSPGAAHEEKNVHKHSYPPKTSTTTKSPTTKTTRTSTTKSVPSTTLKNRPFTIKSSLSIKSKTEIEVNKQNERSTRKPISSTSKETSTTSTTTTSPSTTTVTSTTQNVSQILLDLLTNENHDKDLPKIDTLFTVPHVIDNEPWRPITRPYYETTSKTSTAPIDFTQKPLQEDQSAKDRIGVAEVVDDITLLDSLLTPDDSDKQKEQISPKPVGIYNVDPHLAAEVYVPSPVYTSFTLPTFAPPVRGMETLGSNYPKPHPLPVDKISSVVEVAPDDIPDDDFNDGKPMERPPKDKTTSVTINVIQYDQPDNNTEKVSVDGISILKKHNSTSFVTNVTTAMEGLVPTDTITATPSTPKALSSTTKHVTTNEPKKESTTKRPNNKVSIIPTTGAPIHTWELVNTSTNNNESASKISPQKYYNDTLQAIITKNDAMTPNTTPKFTNKISIIKNLTDIINHHSEDPVEVTSSKPTEKEHIPEEIENERLNTEMRGSVEVVSDEELETTTPRIITLMPAKSNVGWNRPLRPKPKIEALVTKDTLKPMSHSQNNTQINKQSSVLELDKTVSNSSETKESAFFRSNNKIRPGTYPSGNRLPKSSDHLFDQAAASNLVNVMIKHNKTNIPEGTYRVAYHVTGSVSSKKANKTEPLPAYELALEPDVVLEIPVNQSSSLTIDKLKQLANLATISDSYNSSLFRAPGEVISTKAIPSSYTLNQAGFKILTKTYNKIHGSKDDTKSISKPEKTYEKPAVLKLTTEKYIIVESEKEECNNATSFVCSNGACIPITSRCNRLIDCPEGEDERLCNCADYLRAEFSQAKICDGFVDCWDYSDENKCDWCKEGQFVCANARQCVNMTNVCDGTPDCPLGDDEKSCVALGDEIESNEVIPYHEEGFVMVRKRGVWGRLCVESFEDVVAQAHSSLKLPDLGRAICRAMTYQDSPWVREAREGRKVSSVGYWEVWHNKNARAADTRLTFKRSTCARHRALRIRCKDLSCGIRPHADVQQPRVVGGGGAAAGAWPWQAALYRDGDFQCGATLVADQWLLSASHCYYQATEAHWVARLGALRRGAWPRGPWERVTRVRQIVLHPRYAAHGFRNDIALLRIDPVALHARLRPACLPPARLPPPAGKHCTVVGWGQLYEHERVFPDTLQEVELPVISTEECRRRTRLLPLYRVTDDMFCAGYERGGRDACLGDSGGPLMCQEDDRWYIYGVTSNGYGCARANRPGVYTKVSNYIEWIDSVLASHTPARNTTTYDESDEGFYDDLEVAENRRFNSFDTCRGFRCPLGECLPSSSRCNGFIECADGSDEWNCSKNSINSTKLNPD
ncbi:uncharacterized protein LOC121730124 isoform X2 [Aricia agestis]|uniref:uncharacterized protein LOC121730124 isoform X2 n=1 Tax=Aricia agestis TaxID=91739 RepID=UPI001C204914|nr:uncharacterized protein LOC121730124 isoform X2 [Aricia agestis]